jgi:hypothetical protein
MPVTGASSTYRRNRFCVPGEQPRLKKNGASVRVRRSRQCEANPCLPRKGRPFLRGLCRVKTTGTILPRRRSLLFRIAQLLKKSEEFPAPSRSFEGCFSTDTWGPATRCLCRAHREVRAPLTSWHKVYTVVRAPLSSSHKVCTVAQGGRAFARVPRQVLLLDMAAADREICVRCYWTRYGSGKTGVCET